jgi:DNA (cytosine-5)-methyltransferase 1
VRYLSVCSGIEAATVAWEPLGWEAGGFAEIDAFPSAVLAHHFPSIPNYGDFTTITTDTVGAIDILVGGTPCQSFSLAGLRGGLDDDRGNLALEYLRLAQRLAPRWIIWENVPGVLSSGGGRDFGAILGALAELGYGFAYRVLDAQYFGVPQRRRRVFVVGHRGDWRRAAAVLFERYGLQGHPPPRREAGEGLTHDVSPCLAASGSSNSVGHNGGDERIVATVTAKWAKQSGDPAGSETGNLIVFDTTQITSPQNRSNPQPGAPCHTLSASAHVPLMAFQPGNLRREAGAGPSDAVFPTLKADAGDQSPHIASTLSVRRLTPRECERLQGLPDDWTRIPWRGKSAEECPDAPRYRTIGNSMAVPCMRWIGERIAIVEAMA